MNVTLQIQDCTLQELQHIFARLAGPLAAAPVPEPEPAFQPKPAPAAPAEAPAPAPAAEPVPAFQPAAATAPAATPEAPIAEPTAAPAPRRGRPGTAKQRLLEQQAERQRQEQELAAVEVVGKNGIREPLGKAIERLQQEKRRGGAYHVKPVAGRHDDGDIKWWPSLTAAARDLAVTPEHVGKCIKECRKLRGWMLEYDTEPKGGAR